MSAVFGWPAAAPLLLLAPLAWVVLVAHDRARARRVFAIIGARAPRLAGEVAPRRRAWARGLFCAALLASGLALLQPLVGMGSDPVGPKGLDTIICLDVSRSMLARDVPPSRLLAARREIKDLALRTQGDRIGLVAFAGEARILAPLTTDKGAFSELVDLADVLTVAKGGTDLGAALDTALETLGGAAGDHEAIVLITDGEDLGQQGVRAADACRKRGVVVHAAGVGSAGGSKIPVEAGGGEAFLRDRAGAEVVSMLDADGLRALAARTGGRYVDASEPGALARLYDDTLAPAARKAALDRHARVRGNRFQWPLALAVVLFLAAMALGPRRTP